MQLIVINGLDKWIDFLILLAGYAVALSTSGFVINNMLTRISHKSLEDTAGTDTQLPAERKRRLAAGAIIGKCENILIVSFIVLEAYTALALVVTAKTLVRKEEIEKNEMYFLAGTMVNVSYSVLVGFLVKIAIEFL
jgi:hypothetical protein